MFRGETADYAMQRHVSLRPEHAGRLVRIEHRHNVTRGEAEEEAAVFLGATREDMAAARAWLASKPSRDTLGDHVARLQAQGSAN